MGVNRTAKRGSPSTMRAKLPPPYRSRSLDTGLDSDGPSEPRDLESDSDRKEQPCASASHLDVLSSCESYLNQQLTSGDSNEPRVQRRRLSSIAGETDEVIAEEDDDIEGSSLRRYDSEASNLSRKSSFVSKCVNKVKTLMRK